MDSSGDGVKYKDRSNIEVHVLMINMTDRPNTTFMVDTFEVCALTFVSWEGETAVPVSVPTGSSFASSNSVFATGSVSGTHNTAGLTLEESC